MSEIDYIQTASKGIMVVPENQNIYIDLKMFYCSESQTAIWHFKYDNDEIVISGKDLFKLINNLVQYFKS